MAFMPSCCRFFYKKYTVTKKKLFSTQLRRKIMYRAPDINIIFTDERMKCYSFDKVTHCIMRGHGRRFFTFLFYAQKLFWSLFSLFSLVFLFCFSPSIRFSFNFHSSNFHVVKKLLPSKFSYKIENPKPCILLFRVKNVKFEYIFFVKKLLPSKCLQN